MKKLYLYRLHQSRLMQTIGFLVCYDTAKGVVHTFNTLELPDRNNRSNISRIPSGGYIAELCKTGKYKDKGLSILSISGGEQLYGKDNVRSGIRIHSGNFHTDIQGCILVGEELQDINQDGLMDVAYSYNAVEKLISWIGDDSVDFVIHDEK